MTTSVRLCNRVYIIYAQCISNIHLCFSIRTIVVYYVFYFRFKTLQQNCSVHFRFYLFVSFYARTHTRARRCARQMMIEQWKMIYIFFYSFILFVCSDRKVLHICVNPTKKHSSTANKFTCII